ncbi:MAG: hypothetical protein IJI65_02505 [Lachnospiraceae bacterium]|nr:hypothetical protein [Lachnospiraceae bacterium]
MDMYKDNEQKNFTMYVRLDDEKMRRDNIDIDFCYKDIEEVAKSCQGQAIDNSGYVFSDWIHRQLFSSSLQYREWFMKYVCCWKWDIDDPDDQIIRVARECGDRVAYA